VDKENKKIQIDLKHKEEMSKLMEQMTEEAKKLRMDYVKNPSNESGSQLHIHENSPFLATKEERLIKFDGRNTKIKPDNEEKA
tara:strand:- start:583 stop:831 length:249 start_codon:yes stop_codon:yes gene_type:complete